MARRASKESLEAFVSAILRAEGVDEWQVQCTTNSLVSASLSGVDSHGIRLLTMYVASLRGGRTSRQPNISCTRPLPCICVVDADHAIGAAAGYKAIDECMEIASKLGMAIGIVQNSTHPGCMACYTLRAAKRGFLAMAFTNTGAKIQAYGGKRAFFGTNPIAFAAPRVEEDPLCLDMATSIVTWNRVEQSRLRGTSLPSGTCADKEGKETTVANLVETLAPIGGYKGHGLAAMVEVMSCSVTGMAFGWDTLQMFGKDVDMSAKRRLGQCYVVMRCDGAVTEEEFRKNLQEMTDAVRREEPAEGFTQVMMPGDPEIEEAKQRSAQGIPLDGVLWQDFNKMATELNVEPLKLL